MLQCPANCLLVKIDKKYQDELDGWKVDTSYRPEEFATLTGTVHSIPGYVVEDAYRAGIENDVQPGDKVWFSFGVIFDYAEYEDKKNPVYRNLVVYNGEEFWKVDIGEVFCVERAGEKKMISQNVLLEPMKYDGPTKTASGFLLPDPPEYWEDRAKVVAVPKMNVSLSPGDVIPMESQFVQKYIMFGKEHYILPVRRLIAKFN